jgi:diguanylate cyclase (GGDEF)-like protein
LIGVGIDLFRFWFVKNSEYGSSPFTRVGVLIFIIAEGVYLLKEKNNMIIQQGNAELMKKMAYTDALTGLSNRAAYHEKEETLRKSERNCAVVLLDINWLKKVNDEYGHAEGDKHIMAAANVIQDSLSELGVCYRIGGDEFAAVLNTDDTQIIEQALDKLERAEEAYIQAETPPVPLQIAYGYALYFPKNMSLEIAENMADQRMYAMKRMMKTVKNVQ